MRYATGKTLIGAEGRRLRRAGGRRGTTLILLVLLIFGLLGLAALVIDIGFARHARRQMLTATDSAALAGLQGRDATGASPDLTRRQAASDLVAWTFDDDFDTAGGDATNFGAGPVVEFTGGVPLGGTFAGSATMSLPATPTYDPRPRLNLANDARGDLVAGEYATGAGVTHREESDYGRDDFTPQADGAAFLARLRRTGEILPPDVGEAGPRLPYLFARGSLLAVESRGAGIAVRATSIAAGRRAKSVGRARAASDLAGAFPLALTRAAWNASVATDVATTLEVLATGEVQIGGVPAGQVFDGAGAGRSMAIGDAATRTPVTDAAAWVAATLAALPSSRVAYVPLLADAGLGIDDRVVGFGYLDSIVLDGGAPARLLVVRRADRIAAENATATVTRGFDLLFTDQNPDPQLSLLLAQHAAVDDSLRAAALVR